MPIKDSAFFKLDSNIDGFYSDAEEVNHIINNMIGVVGAADGPPAFPASTLKEAPLSESDITELKNLGIRPDRIKNNYGHGLIYDKDGNYRARKGEMFFRDGKGNFSTLFDLSNKSKHIKTDGTTYRLKDDSLQQAGYLNELGIRLDELLRTASTSTDKISTGNILQLTRNGGANVSSVDIPFVSTSVDAVVSLTGRIIVGGRGFLKIIHNETSSELAKVYFNHPEGFAMPTYINYVGPLPDYFVDDIPETSSSTVENCGRVLWDFKKKSFYRSLDRYISDDTKRHSVRIECYEDDDDTLKVFQRGFINGIVMDDILKRAPAIYKGDIRVANQTEIVINFDVPYADDNYSISFQTEESVQCWYENKDRGGFVIRLERGYGGRLFWTTVRNP